MPDVSKERIGIKFQNSSPKKSEERINILQWLFMPLKMTPLSCFETCGTSSSDVAVLFHKNKTVLMWLESVPQHKVLPATAKR